MKKHKNYRYDPLKISVIIVVGTILLVLFVNSQYKETIRYAIMTCTNNTTEETYSEKVTFKFLAKQNGILYEFYRDEKYSYDDPEKLNKLFDYLVEYRNNMKSIIDTTNLKYDINKHETSIDVNTYIKVGSMASIFNSYAENFGITKDSTAKEVYEKMTTNNAYTCVEMESQ